MKTILSALLTGWKAAIFGVLLVRIFPYSTEYGEILRISPYSVRVRENADQNNTEYGHFLRSDYDFLRQWKVLKLVLENIITSYYQIFEVSVGEQYSTTCGK